MINYVFPEFKINKINNINDTGIKNSKIFPKYYSYFVDDFLSGKVDDVEINITETKLGYYPWVSTKKDGLNSNTFRAHGVDSKIFPIAIGIYFAGIILPLFLYKFYFQTSFDSVIIPTVIYWIIAIIYLNWWRLQGIIVDTKFNKSFAGHTIIVPKNVKQPKLDKRYEKVKLEDVDFMKEYNVYSTQQIEARYILTTGFIKRFRDIRISFNENSLKCSFLKNRMLIAISTSKNLFNIVPTPYYKDTTREKATRAFKEIFSIISIIEQLKLNQKIGL